MILSDTAKEIFNSMNEGINIIDASEVIIFANTAYKNFLHDETGISVDEVEGKKLRSLRPGARLPEVFVTGKAEMQTERKETSDIYFVNMYPVIENGVIIAGISVVTFMKDAANFRKKMEDLERRNRQILHRVNETSHKNVNFDYIVSRSRKSQECKEFARRIAESKAPVLLMCESGTGKDLYARAIHNESSRRFNVFARINCATFDPKTLESELVGYEEGAFEGAKKGGKIGLFEAADGGTLFVDEISELNLDLQSKLLHTIQEGTVRPIGSVEEIAANPRIIAASNVDLKECVENGSFRADLYYALSSFAIRIPPLRERMEDLPLLAQQIVEETSIMLKRKVVVTDDALERLMAHDWPGNIRELRSVLEFSAYIAADGRITSVHLPENIGRQSERISMPLYDRVRDFERREILKTLDYYGSDLPGKKAAAKELGISLASLYSKLK